MVSFYRPTVRFIGGKKLKDRFCKKQGLSDYLFVSEKERGILMNTNRKTKQDNLDNLFSTLAEKKQFNGTILVAEKGEIIYKEAFGFADFKTERKLTSHSIFDLASVSKAFTAMGVIILQEQGKLSYDDPVKNYIPELPYPGITIRHLLQHTSGLPDYMSFFLKQGDRSKFVTNKDVLDMLKKYQPPVRFQPNEQWEYGNTGYILLALLTERVSGMSYADFLQTEIFQPLGMQHTRVYNRRYSREIIEDYAYGHVYSAESNTYELPDHVPSVDYVVFLDGVQGDGAISSNVDDMLRWDRALYTDKLVKKTTLEEAFRPVKLNNQETFDYGFGWLLPKDQTGGRIVSHSGGWPGYHTYFIRYIDADKTIICLNNIEQDTAFEQMILAEVDNILFERPYTIPASPPAEEAAVEIDTTVYSQYTGTYQLSPETEIEVTQKEARLFFQLPVLSMTELLPLSETRFFPRATFDQVEFIRNASGKATDMILYSSGQSSKAVRIQ